MTKEFIESIFARIATELPEVKKTGVFNQDFDRMDDGSIASFNYPAIFLSFPEDVSYLSTASGVQKTDEFIIRLYIANKYVTEKNVLDIFDLKQKVFTKFHAFSPVTAASSMERISETADESRQGIYIFMQDYSVKLIDDSNYILNKRVLVDPWTLGVETDVKIDPVSVTGVRTGKIDE